MPLVSIITATYNSENEILETYYSIKNQSVIDFEWLITDDCSSDNTRSLLVNLAKDDDRIKVFLNDVNSGAAVSRNNSLKHASGEFIAFIDSDDLWVRDKLEKQIKFMRKNGVAFSFTAYSLIDKCGKDLNRIVDSRLKNPVTYNDMLFKKATLGCSTVMLKRNGFENISMPNIRTGQDYALWLNLLKETEFAFPISEVLTRYRILPNSISRNKFKKAIRQWSIYRDLEKLSLIKSLFCFFFYAWRAVFRK